MPPPLKSSYLKFRELLGNSGNILRRHGQSNRFLRHSCRTPLSPQGQLGDPISVRLHPGLHICLLLGLEVLDIAVVRRHQGREFGLMRLCLLVVGGAQFVQVGL